MSELPGSVIREDRKLDTQKESAAEALMKLRWHWTLDEDNPRRVSLREYARQVGKAERTIRRDAHGHALLGADASVRTPSEARERVMMASETEAATDAVAKARGVSFAHTRKDRPVEVRRVREMARQRAEDKGTTVEEEAPKAAEMIVRSERADARIAKGRDRAKGLRYIEVEGSLAKAMRHLKDAVDAARHAELAEDEVELLTSSIANVRAVLNLVDVAVAGAADVDWDAELLKLGDR